MRQLHVILTVSAVIIFGMNPLQAQAPVHISTTPEELAEAASALKPSLSKEKALAIALGARQAAKRYGVDPFVLLSIAFQESTFRTNLPKGPAGELGMCQVLFSWSTNRAFRKEFGRRTEADFNVPSNSFLYAAWILDTVRTERGINGALPSWTYYNGYSLKARRIYFGRILRHLATTQLNVTGSK